VPKISAATLQEHRAETIDRLLDSWGDLVMAKGFDTVTLADVAAQVGLARTAIYNYFPDREALLFAWTDREVRRTVESLEQELANVDSYAEKLRVFVHSQLVEFGRRHLPPGKEVVQFLRPETYGRFMDHIEPLEKVLRDIISEGVAAKEFTDVDPASTVPMVMACIGAERVPLATGTDKIDVATDRVTQFVLRALGA
jgi:AcrR family transcriptional regulator